MKDPTTSQLPCTISAFEYNIRKVVERRLCDMVGYFYLMTLEAGTLRTRLRLVTSLLYGTRGSRYWCSASMLQSLCMAVCRCQHRPLRAVFSNGPGPRLPSSRGLPSD